MLRFLLAAGACVCALVSPAWADTVTVVPAAPLPGEPFFLRVYGVTPSSFTPFVPYRVELVGSEIQVDGCVSGAGFAVPGFYWRSIPVVGLPPGGYAVTVRRAVCQDLAQPLSPWEFRTSTAFVVDEANASIPGTAARVPVWEYFNASTLEYFLTSDEREMVALETGRIPGWSPTYQAFDLDGVEGEPWCRFYSSAFPGKAPHFYTARPDECAAVKGDSHWTFEGTAGRAHVPDANGGCGARVPLYRAYNDGKFGAPNHRYRRQNPLLDMVLYQGWIDEGIVACLPP